MTTTTQKLELTADTVLVKLYGGVSGITRRTNREDEERDGKKVTVTREVSTTQADALEAEKAKKLLGKLRAIVDSYTATVLNLTIASAADLPKLREEIAPVQAQIEAHNASARYHKIDRSLIMAPIGLKADPAALAEICRQISDELKTARAFFDVVPVDPERPDHLNLKALSVDEWKVPVKNWVQRTNGLGALFPTITGQCIAEAIESVKVLRDRVFKLARAKEGVGQSPESALRGALTEVTADPSALGLLDSAIGLTVITSAEAKAGSDALRAAGNEVTASEVH